MHPSNAAHFGKFTSERSTSLDRKWQMGAMVMEKTGEFK